jgi:hypothetical protein
MIGEMANRAENLLRKCTPVLDKEPLSWGQEDPSRHDTIPRKLAVA